MLYPLMFCDVLAVHERLTECCGGGVPLPVKVSTVGEFEALLVNETLPEAAPVAAGVKVTVNCTCWPAGIVTGNEIPLTAKAEPFKVSEDTVTLSPLAVSVPVLCELVPTTTFPKSMLVGPTANVP